MKICDLMCIYVGVGGLCVEGHISFFLSLCVCVCVCVCVGGCGWCGVECVCVCVWVCVVERGAAAVCFFLFEHPVPLQWILARALQQRISAERDTHREERGREREEGGERDRKMNRGAEGERESKREREMVITA